MFNMLKAAVIKETRIIFRDIEALAILFVLPAAFVLIMSLALQDAFREQAGIKFSMLIVNKDKGEVGKSLVDAFNESHYFDVIIPESIPDTETITRETNDGKYQFALVIPEKASSHAVENSKYLLTGQKKYKKDAVEIKLYVDPAIRGDHRSVVLATLNKSIKEIENTILVEAIGKRTGLPGKAKSKNDNKPTLFSEVKDPFENRIGDKPTPTSVQQNAPGWGLLAMFFLVIPLAGTLVRERNEGSLLRLQTMAAPISILLAGKIVPYFVVNQIQIGLILLEGVYLLPLLGGEKLEMGPHPEAIIPLSFAISFAAIGYGLMVAAFCRTAEQATSFGATSILILGALGGIMVPKIVMPPLMQEITVFSPMSWGLDGFLAIFVRGADVSGILLEVGVMLAFGFICLTIGIIRFNYKLTHA
ncbi:MAG: ABC transporter permease [Acidiferrobacterales bacterium]